MDEEYDDSPIEPCEVVALRCFVCESRGRLGGPDKQGCGWSMLTIMANVQAQHVKQATYCKDCTQQIIHFINSLTLARTS